MPWSSGTFSRTNGVNTGSTTWQTDRDGGTKIVADRHDTHDQDLADGINAAITKDGSNAFTGNADLGSNKLTSVAEGTARTDGATIAQLQDGGDTYAADTGAADVYAMALSPAITAYVAGQRFSFKATNANTGASTLNVNTVGAKNILKHNDVALASGDIEAGQIVEVEYDGTSFQMLSQLGNAPAGGDMLGANNLSDVDTAATALSNIGGIGAATTDTLTNKTFDANGTGNSLSNVDVADLANGTDGELITWDAAGAPTTVSVGTSGQVLTSNGVGAAPTFQAASGGKVVARYYVEDAVERSTTALFNNTDTIITISMGTEILTLTTATLASSSNRIRCMYGATMGMSASGSYYGMALYNGATNAIHAVMEAGDAAGDYPENLVGMYEYAPGATTALTISVRYGAADSGTVYIGGASAAKWGGTRKTFLIVEEIEP